MKLSLRPKLTILFLILSLGPLALVSWMAYARIQKALIHNMGTGLEELASQTIEKIDRTLFFVREDIKAWSTMELMQDVIADDPDGRIAETLKRLKESYGIFSDIFCVNESGHIVASSDAENVGKDVAGASWFERARSQDEMYIGPLEYDDLVHGFAINFTIPIFSLDDSKKKVGYLSSRFNWSELFEITNSIRLNEDGQTESSYALLIDRKGNVISGPGFVLDMEEESEVISGQNLISMGYQSGEDATQGGKGYRIEARGSKGNWLLGYAGSLGYRDFKGFGWSIVILRETKEAFIPVFKLRNQFLGVSLFVALGVILLAFWISGNISKPVQNLTGVARVMMQGDLSKRVNIRSRDEIGELSDTFNKMADSIQEKNRQLQTANEELQVTNEELTASNEELITANDEIRRTQEKLLQQEKLAAVGQLASGVGHELRNPLGVIKNAAYFIKTKVPQDDEKLRKHLTIMEREIGTAARLVDDLLSFSKTRKPMFALADVHSVIEEALSVMNLPENIRVSKQFASGIKPIQIDRDQIRQVLVNFVMNASQAMNEAGGMITISTMEKNGNVAVGVRDTGCGIPQENLHKIFDAFFTTKPKGVGLGLAVCHGIVEKHGGKIEVKSRVGEGTEFTILIPTTVSR